MQTYKSLRKYIDGSVFILLLSCVLYSWTYFSDNHTPVEEKYQVSTEWTVEDGESLWAIASSISDDHDMTIEQTISWMKSKNDLDNESIFPGQRLDVPTQLTGVAQE
ncbi:hypothetical protein CR203_03600 [Salipaludibacillus neizhouensis]|uniref:LysM domain-containing protein n=1 Tax=Salipaludibacillus neizhouensis TaxID=885475 RepID=A0A3A9KF06_9BACI|nr:LysM peptidoglycan-binding domain-containing protein [Salipaludibacillus neizhouensis]RKL69131.1 hypothetical protein CR203_03600 [Salipaludibacillus neizhouensis]